MSLKGVEFENEGKIEIAETEYDLINIKNGNLTILDFNGDELDEDYNIFIKDDNFYFRVNKTKYIFKLDKRFDDDLLWNFNDRDNDLQKLYYKFTFKNNNLQYILIYYKNSGFVRISGLNSIEEIYNIFKIKNYICYICDDIISIDNKILNIRIEFNKGKTNYFTFIKNNLNDTYKNINNKDKIENLIKDNDLLNINKLYKKTYSSICVKSDISNDYYFVDVYDYNSFEPSYIDKLRRAYYKIDITINKKGRKFDYNYIVC